ncbi:hypothetical protein B5F07_03250 [Lachnoclostridium sp. An169]|nr:hypothetical protein B5F07_03250 [Lachnoclostridium sp. An169]
MWSVSGNKRGSSESKKQLECAQPGKRLSAFVRIYFGGWRGAQAELLQKYGNVLKLLWTLSAAATEYEKVHRDAASDIHTDGGEYN